MRTYRAAYGQPKIYLFIIRMYDLLRMYNDDSFQGYGFITYQEAEDAKKALEHLNGFELAGRPMKVSQEVSVAAVFVVNLLSLTISSVTGRACD